MPAPSNIYQFCFAFQSAKGAPASAPQFRTRVMSADIAPIPERDRVEETGTGRDGGDRFTSRIHVEGGVEAVLRPLIAGAINYGIMGATVPAGAAAVFNHLATPADDQPYITVWRSLGNVLHERYDDCKFGSVTYSGDAGQPVQFAANVLGLKPTRVNSVPAGGAIETGVALRVPGVEYQIGGEAMGLNKAVTTFSVEINAEQTAIQTTEIYDEFLEPGLRTITANWTEVFRNRNLYDKIIYGSVGGTEPSEEIYHDPWGAKFGDMDAGPGFEIRIPHLAYMAAPLEPDPGGDPLMMECSGEADTPVSGNIIELETCNSRATYAAAA